MADQRRPSLEMSVNPWDKEAARFDEAADHGLADPVTRAAWRTVLLAHLPEPPARIIDLGCGTATLTVLLAQAGFNVHAVDSSPAMLDRAREKVVGAGLTVEFSEADAADPPIPPGSVDVVLCRHVLWALPDPVAALTRWIELLAPGGRLVLIEGRWNTGAGIDAARCTELLTHVGRQPAISHLNYHALWGKTITDERYLAIA